MCACRDRQEFHCSKKQAEIVPLLSNDDFFSPSLPPLPSSSPFQNSPFLRVRGGRESDLIKKHRKYKSCAFLVVLFKSGLGCLCSVGILEARKSSPWRGAGGGGTESPRRSGGERHELEGRARVQRVLRRGAAPTLFLLADQRRLVDILLSMENAISLYIEFLLVKFKIDTPSQPLSNSCLCLLTNRVWQLKLGEQPLSDPVTRNFYYSQLELRKG